MRADIPIIPSIRRLPACDRKTHSQLAGHPGKVGDDLRIDVMNQLDLQVVQKARDWIAQG